MAQAADLSSEDHRLWIFRLRDLFSFRKVSDGAPELQLTFVPPAGAVAYASSSEMADLQARFPTEVIHALPLPPSGKLDHGDLRSLFGALSEVRPSALHRSDWHPLGSVFHVTLPARAVSLTNASNHLAGTRTLCASVLKVARSALEAVADAVAAVSSNSSAMQQSVSVELSARTAADRVRHDRALYTATGGPDSADRCILVIPVRDVDAVRAAVDAVTSLEYVRLVDMQRAMAPLMDNAIANTQSGVSSSADSSGVIAFSYLGARIVRAERDRTRVRQRCERTVMLLQGLCKRRAVLSH